MRGISKKMFISILTSVIVMVTMVATTFAWVGIFTYANTEKFSLNLRVQNLDMYYFLTISGTGEKGTFGSEINPIDIKKQIINDKYGDKYKNSTNEIIEKIFDKIRLEPITTDIKEDNSLDTFYAVEYDSRPLKMKESKDYYKFDIYLSVDTKEGISDYTSENPTTGINTNILLSNLESTLEGTLTTGLLINGNPFLEMPSSPINDLYSALKLIPTKYSLNSKNATRFALSLYNPISIDDNYSGNEKPAITKIFEGGNEIPSYDVTTNSFDLGGCLPVDKNLAIYELLTVRPYLYEGDPSIFNETMEKAINRNDLEINEENSYLWDKTQHSSYLGCMNGYQTKMKITVHFWFEGWDADCLKLIEEMPVALNLAFTSGLEQD